MSIKTLITAIGFLCLASQATADVLATRTRTAAFVSTALAAAKVLVPTNNAGSTSMTIVTTRDNQRVVITYNAECSVTDDALSPSVYLDLDILVDGAGTNPTADDQAYCTSDDQAGGNWVSAIASAVFVIPEPGLHTVQVRAGLAFPGGVGDSFSLDDTTVVVQE